MLGASSSFLFSGGLGLRAFRDLLVVDLFSDLSSFFPFLAFSSLLLVLFSLFSFPPPLSLSGVLSLDRCRWTESFLLLLDFFAPLPGF